MANKRNTKRALLSSGIALLVSIAMLVGSTYAWFTDSVTSGGNKIVSGKLDVDLYMWTDTTDSTEITNESAPIFGAGSLAQNNNAETLWEPGKTQVAYLSIKNNGNLDLKYMVNVDVNAENSVLYEVMEYDIVPDAKFGDVTAWNGGENVEKGINKTEAEDVALKAGEEHFFALAIHMEEEAGNKYQNGKVSFDVKVLATQLASEEDSFGKDYDKLAAYAYKSYGEFAPGATHAPIEVEDEDGNKVGSFEIPKEAIVDGVDMPSGIIEPVETYGNITVVSGEVAQTYNVEVPDLKEGNTVPVPFKLKAGPDLDDNYIKVYHYDDLIPASEYTYNPTTGYVSLQSTEFSPFTVVYNPDKKYVAPDPQGKNLPVANVVRSTEYENVDLEWGNYGQWSPTEGLGSKLEAAYTFSCKDTPEEAEASDYANWYCDFYVKLDKDLAPNQIFLGGNYGSFGWIGFHNGDVTLKANEELPLLGSVTTNPWTYSEIANFVGEFICGVGDVNDALADATFTVMLRLTNPEDENEFYNVAEINHTFTKTVNSGEELQDAIDNGNTNIELGGDIDLSQGIVIPGN